MKKFFLLLLTIFFASMSSAQNIAGTWSGVLSVPNTKLRIVFNITAQNSAYMSTMDSPDQGAFGLPTTRTTFTDNKLEIVATQLGLFYRGNFEGDSIVGTFNQGGLAFPLVLKRSEKPQSRYYQTPQGPFPYISEQVTIVNDKDNISLGGTFTRPQKGGQFATVILVSGSGPNDRDETIFGHKPFLVLSDFLTRNGFAVVRYDKRGIGQSTGDYGKASITDFVRDAASVLEFMKSRKDVDKEHIYIIGHSEGSIIAAMMASQNSGIDGIVSMAGPGIKGLEIVQDQNRINMTAQGINPDTIEYLLALNRNILQEAIACDGSENASTSLKTQLASFWEHLPVTIKNQTGKEAFVDNNFKAMITPSYRSFLATDPAEWWDKIHCAVLAINGEKDTQVLAEKNLNAIRQALLKANNRNFEIKSYPQLNHLFQNCNTGFVNEYGTITQTISPQVLEDILKWLQIQIRN